MIRRYVKSMALQNDFTQKHPQVGDPSDQENESLLTRGHKKMNGYLWAHFRMRHTRFKYCLAGGFNFHPYLGK